MTFTRRHRIIRVATDDEQQLEDTVTRAVAEGWIFDSQASADDGSSTDLVFRRARPGQPRVAWS